MKKLVLAAIVSAAMLVRPFLSFAQAPDPVQVRPAGDGTGAAVMVDPTQASSIPAFIRNNWGKILSGLGAALAYERVAHNNDLWPYKQTSEGGSQNSDAAGTKAAEAGAGTSGGGAGNVSVNVAKNSGQVEINVYSAKGEKAE